MNDSTWGEWRSLLHELEPSFEGLDRVRARALAALAATDEAWRARVATYAEDVIPLSWTFDELVAYWRGDVVESRRIGHISLGEPARRAREKLLGEVTREDRHGLYVLMCEPYWVFVDAETERVNQVLVNAPGAFQTPDGVIAMGALLRTLGVNGLPSIDATWKVEGRPGVCFGPILSPWGPEDDLDDTSTYEGRIEWIAVTPHG